ncbi:PH domain-containing protein [Nonomuraea sp. NPDC050556]|uniref:PH domain-containing protein n=1 Tax=Nonomuraea sp. NPDC050556 TaxID=3364369 RepID=UPI0037AB1E90
MSEWNALSRRSLGAAAVLSIWLVVPALVVLGKIMLGLDWPPLAIAAAGVGAVLLIVGGVVVYDLIRLRNTSWRLTGERLELRSGIAVREHRSVPLERVRSVDLKADPVRRAFGLAVVKVGTGEHEGDLTLDALTRADAEELRRTLLQQEVPGQDGALATLDWSWIRFAPLTVWSFVGGAVAVGAISKLLDMLGVNLFTTDTAERAWAWASDRLWLAIPLVLLANVLVGVVGAVAVYAESWGGYRLEREPGRLRLRRGLLTKRSLTLEERRLRGVHVGESLLLRLGGGARVKAVATGLRKAKDDETEDVAALTPPMPRTEAYAVAERIAPGAFQQLRKHPRAALHKRLRRAVVTMVVLAALLAVVPGWWWTLPLAALPFALWYAADTYHGLGHALGERHLVTRSGSAMRGTVALDRSGIVGWTISQSFFQRRLGLLTVSATTAAGDGHYDVLDAGGDEGLDLAARAVPGLLEPFLR